MLGQTARQSDLLIATFRPAAKVGTNCGVTWILSIARRYRCHVSSLSDVLRKYAERGDEGLLPAAEEIAQHGYLAEYLYRLAGSDHLASCGPLVGYRHPNGFSKIRLVGLTDYGWAARLHVWNVGSSDRDIHSHRWPFASYVLSGSLVERRYESNRVFEVSRDRVVDRSPNVIAG